MEEKATGIFEKFPDIWFDFFGRLIPGIIGLLLFFYLFGFTYGFIKFNAWQIAIGGYLLGHLIQPLSSFILRLDKKFREPKALLVSKSYAELAGFISLFIITLLCWTLYHFKIKYPEVFSYISSKEGIVKICSITFLVYCALRWIATRQKFKEHKVSEPIKNIREILSVELTADVNDTLKQQIYDNITTIVTAQINAMEGKIITKLDSIKHKK